MVKIIVDDYIVDRIDKEYNYLEDDITNENVEEGVQKCIWLCDLYSDLSDLLTFYSDNDNRFKYITLSDIFGGCRSSRKIFNDSIINEFIDDFLKTLGKFTDKVKNKKLIPKGEDDLSEWNKLSNLNADKIYSRISYCIYKYYL